MNDLKRFLKQHRFFSGLDDRALDDVARHLITRRVQREEQILIEGEPADCAYLIIHGQVRIYRLAPNGREQALMDLFPGQMFNLVPLIDGQPAPSSAVARTEGYLYGINKESFDYLRKTYPLFGDAVLRDIAGRLRHLTGLIEDLGLRTVPQRLARFLLQMADVEEPAAHRFTQQDVATKLGTVREVISRTMRKFESQGLISVNRHRVLIQDRERLVALADLDED